MEPPARAQTCDVLGGTVDADRRCQVQIATATYEIGFNFPVDYPDQQTLTDYLTQERDEFIDFVADAPPRDFPYSLAARATAYHSGTPTSGTVSLVFDRGSDTGAHPVTHFDAFTYDLAKAVPITLATLFKPGIQPVEVLDPIVRRELVKKSQGQENPMPNTLGARMYENFAITDEAVIFFIGQGAWLSQLAGPQEISVPRAELAALLAY
ncbi:esterase [Mycobacterium sp.]|uniref:esterase n=1 Tax=Mycobacterium sp. TaxID=1785 RepID=UPI002D8334CE|nr:esterase [Mycobacterium sp.]